MNLQNLYHTHHKTLFYSEKLWNKFGYGIKPDGVLERKKSWLGYKPAAVYPLKSKLAEDRRWAFVIKNFEFLVSTTAAKWAIENPESDADAIFNAAYAATQEPNLFTDIWGSPIPSLPPKDAQWLQDLFEQVVAVVHGKKPLPDHLCMIAPPGYYSKWQWYQWGYYVPEDTPIALSLKTADDTQPIYTFEDVFPIFGEAALTRRILYHREVIENYENRSVSGRSTLRSGYRQAGHFRHQYCRSRPHHRRNR